MKSKIINSLLLLLTAMIWGSSFVAQSVSVEFVGPFTFQGIRTTMGGLVLLPLIAFLERGKPVGDRRPLLPIRTDKKLLEAGIVCGIIMAVASNLQQIGIQYTTAGKCGFITAFYVMLVPVIATVFLRRRYRWMTWLGVAVAMLGFYFLCIQDDFSVARGDMIVFLCAVGFSLHILAIDHYVDLVDGVRFSCLQFLVSGIVSLICMVIFEKPQLPMILAAWKPILYSGILSCGVGYTLQVLCQKNVEPALASLLMSLESVFSVLFGWLLLHELLSARELIGCALTFAAVLLVELTPEKAQAAEAD